MRVIGRLARVSRRWLLRVAGVPLATGFERLARSSRRRAGVALVYHIVADPPGDLRRELLPALGPRLFRRQLRHLASHYRLVTASELPAAVRTRSRGERFPVAITFDDDVASHTDVAAPLLAEQGARATFFLTGASLSEPAAFWWQRLQSAVDDGLDLGRLGLRTAGGAGIHELARAIEGLPADERRRIDALLGEMVQPEDADAGLGEHEVRRLASAGHEIGFHTRSHDPLPDLDRTALEQALASGRADLEVVVGTPLTSVAYPHGRADERVARAARAGGFEVGYTGDPEPVTPWSDDLLLGRVSPSYESTGELAFDVAWTLFKASPER